MIKRTLQIGAVWLFLASQVQAAPEAGDKTFTLSGSGGSDQDFDTNTFGANAELGYFATDYIQWGVRQTLNTVAVDEGDDTWSGATRLFGDLHFGNGPFIPFVGLNVGGIYGENIDETGTAGVELGFKGYVKNKTYITLQAEYVFLFESTDDIDSSYDDGAIFYSLGIGYNF